EVSQLDAVVFDQGLDDGIERLLDDLLRLELRQPDLLGDGFDNLFLGHVGIPSESRPLEAEWHQKSGAAHVPSVIVPSTSVKIAPIRGPSRSGLAAWPGGWAPVRRSWR